MLKAQYIIDTALRFVQEKENVFFNTEELYQHLNEGIFNFCVKSYCLMDFVEVGIHDFKTDFPAEILSIREIAVKGKKLQGLARKDALTMYMDGETDDKGTPVKYFQDENSRKLYVYPRPDRYYKAMTWSAVYPKKVRPEGGSQIVEVPIQYESALVNYMIWALWRKDKEELAAEHLALYSAEIIRARSVSLGMRDNISKTMFPSILR